jgi:hypothetical protein
MPVLCALGLLVSQVAAQEPTAAQAAPKLPGTQVLIPFDQLQNLLKAQGAAEDAPPVDYVFAPASYTATVTDGRVTYQAEVEIEVLAKRWTLAPLGSVGTGVASVLVDGKPAQLVVRDETLHAIFSEPGKFKLQLAGEVPLTNRDGRQRLDLPLLPSPLAMLSLEVPVAGLEFESESAIAPKSTEAGQRTTYTATFQGGGAAIEWRPRPAADRPPRLYSQAQTILFAETGLVRAESQLSVEIAHGPARSLQIQTGATASIIQVAGKGVVGWSEETEAAQKFITVRLAKPTLGEQSLTVLYEFDVAEGGKPTPLDLAQLSGARRSEGLVAVSLVDALELAAIHTDMTRVGVAQLPTQLANPRRGTLAMAYRYTAQSPAIALSLRELKQQPAKRFATTNTLVSVRPGQLACEAIIQYELLHQGIDRLEVALPADIEVLAVSGTSLRDHRIVAHGAQIAAAGAGRTLVVELSDLVEETYELRVRYTRRFKPTELAPEVPLLSHPTAEIDRGYVAVEVRGNYEATPAAKPFERIDVKELPGVLWSLARSPLILGYRYDTPVGSLALGLTRHRDLDVLVAMSDVCEASTVITPDGKCVTKLMFVVRNNLKQHMTLQLPKGAEIWSALVNDRPVTPAQAKTGVLIPLQKSEPVEEDDEDSYRAKREARRKGEGDDRRVLREMVKRLDEIDEAPSDLKPYDVEIVFVSPRIELRDQGELSVQLPQADVPVGHLAWAIFLPDRLNVVDSAGNLQEVPRFTLPFQHFADVKLRELQRESESLAQRAEAVDALKKLEEVQQSLAAQAKAAGVLPVRVEIPITGQIHRFEKFLVVDEAAEATLTYRRRL